MSKLSDKLRALALNIESDAGQTVLQAASEIDRLTTELENLRTLARIANIGPSYAEITKNARHDAG